MNETPELIAQFQKNSTEIIKVHIKTWKGRRYIDFRIWYLENPAEPGSEIATKKGITLNVDHLEELKKAVDKALAAVEVGEMGQGS